ncbi:MAG: helix-turn-helix transcriptional regulator [Alphaproteobacteria bacterium]|nr:helix-turn-helix transcriptional regulator [Alphaproteobacteria bacterium]
MQLGSDFSAPPDMPPGQAAEPSFRALVQCLSEPLIVLGRDRRVHFANAAAEAALRQISDLTLHGGVLISRDRDLQNRLGSAIESAVAKPDLPSAVLLDPAADGSCVMLHISLMTQRVEAMNLPWLIARICSTAVGTPDLDIVRQTFGLSQAEAEIALQISAGHSPRHIALRRASSEETVRWHIKNIYSKTYTSRLAGLTRQLAAARSPFMAGQREATQKRRVGGV